MHQHSQLFCEHEHHQRSYRCRHPYSTHAIVVGPATSHVPENHHQWYFPTRHLVRISSPLFVDVIKTDWPSPEHSTSAISITRTVAVYTVSEKDITWNFIPVMLYSTLEIDTGLICSCLPVMGPLLQLLYSKRPKGSSDSYNQQGDYRLRRSKTERHPMNSFSRLRDHDQRSEYTKQNREVNVEGGGFGHNGGGGDNEIYVVSSVDIIDSSTAGSK